MNHHSQEREGELPPLLKAQVENAPSTLEANRALSSRSASPSLITSSKFDLADELPNNVSTRDQLAMLPVECLSNDPHRPLRHVDEMGMSSHYALRPFVYSVFTILLVELLERFAFYGINYTQTAYLTGVYDREWNAGMASVSAASYVSVSVAVAYTCPYIGAILADRFLGDFATILVGCVGFYLPGLLLIALTSIPDFFGPTFSRSALKFGLLFLWPVGTGIVKSAVNVFGARQFHPLLQSSMIEAYYVKFYMCINIGALVGGVIVPVWVQENVTVAYMLPVFMLTTSVVVFLVASPRYVRSKPKGAVFGKKYRRTGDSQSKFSLFTIFRISFLIMPFSIAYSQMATTFIIQGTVMEKAFFGHIDAACMNNADAITVLFFGYLIGTKLYPFLAAKGIKIPTSYKFAIGSCFGTVAIGWALIVERKIHMTYATSGEKISVLWQAGSYILLGIGEIFSISAAYEAAYKASPPDNKVFASATNLFCIGGLPNVFCLGLYQVCAPWFENRNGNANIGSLHSYSTAHVGNYFWVLFTIAFSGVVINLLPAVRHFIEETEDNAAEANLLRTPKTPPVRPSRRGAGEEEESPLVRIRRHQAYLKYGSGPDLYKSNSMRAGPSLAREAPQAGGKPEKHVRRHQLRALYGRQHSGLPTGKGRGGSSQVPDGPDHHMSSFESTDSGGNAFGSHHEYTMLIPPASGGPGQRTSSFDGANSSGIAFGSRLGPTMLIPPVSAFVKQTTTDDTAASTASAGDNNNNKTAK